MSFLLKVLAVFGELLIKFGLKKKSEADASKAKALEKTVEGVGESLDVEKKVRDGQEAVDKKPSDVKDDDGGLNFDRFNSGE